MTPITMVGAVGLILIIMGWIVSIRSIPPISLSGLYALGSFFLLLYSYFINDWLFLALNFGAVLISGIQFFRGLFLKFKKIKNGGAAGGIRTRDHRLSQN